MSRLDERVLYKSHRPQPCSFCHSGFFRNLFRPKKFEFCTNFSSENCVRSNSPFSMFSVCSCFEKSFLCLCQFTDSKNIGRFRKRNLPATIPGDTEFEAEHEYENRLVKFVKLRLLSGKQISWNFECKCWFLSVLGFFYVSKKRARLGPVTLFFKSHRPQLCSFLSVKSVRRDQFSIIFTTIFHEASI